MTYYNIPIELRETPQWVVWRAVPKQVAPPDAMQQIADGTTLPQAGVGDDGRQPKLAKIPYWVRQPHRALQVNGRYEAGSLATFEEALALLERDPSFSGLGFVLTSDDPYVCLDFDDPFGLPEDVYQNRARLMGGAIAVGTYAEHSPSGMGVHVWLRGRTIKDGTKSTTCAAEIYASRRFITCTGNWVRNDNCRSVIGDGQAVLDSIGAGSAEAAAAMRAANDGGQLDCPWTPKNLTNEQVIERAMRHPGFRENYDRIQWGDANEGQDWSKGFTKVLAALNACTGSVTQMRRILHTLPMVHLSPPPATGYRDRHEKAERTFDTTLATVRGWWIDKQVPGEPPVPAWRRAHAARAYYTADGERLWRAVEAEAERVAKLRVEAEVRAADMRGKISANAAALLHLFPELEGEQHQLLRPPGLTGDYVRACEDATHLPFLKFAVPATLACLSGIMGRRWKTPSGGGLNLNFIVAALTSTGKTNTMDAWEGFIDQVVEGEARRRVTLKKRVLNSSTSSMQALMGVFKDKPSLIWRNDEAHGLLMSMARPGQKNPNDANLRDGVLMVYDASRCAKQYSPPISVAGNARGDDPVLNLNVSLYWTLTPNKFDAMDDDALDGFLSRMIVVRHNTEAGASNFNPRPYLPDHLYGHLRDILANADQMDSRYDTLTKMPVADRGNPWVTGGPGEYLVCANGADVQEMHQRHVLLCEAVKNASHRGELPPVYTAISRLPLNAMRVASLLACVDNPMAPRLNAQQYRWAFGYLLQNLVSLLSDVDQGELGAMREDDETALVRCWRSLAPGCHKRGLPGVPRGELVDALKKYPAFKGKNSPASKLASDCVDRVLREGAADHVIPATGKRGKPTQYILTVEGHPLWR